MRGAARVVGWVGAAVVAGGLLVGCRPIAADLVVNRAADGADAVPGDGVCEVVAGAGDCSLRAAIDEADATLERDRITILPGVAPSLGATLPPITADLVVEGGGAVLHERIHHVAGALELRDLTVTGVVATTGCGAGIESLGGSVELLRVRVVDNRLDGPDGSRGGGVCAEGPLTVRGSTIAGNDVSAGADGSGGGIWAGSSLTVASSTISGNVVQASTGGSGAGISVDGPGPLLIGLSTITDNAVDGGASAISAPDAPGLISSTTIAGGAGGPTVDLGGDLEVAGTILASAGEACAPARRPVSLGRNLVSDPSCALADPTDAVGDALLGPLGDHGGETATRVPGPASPAIDAIPDGTDAFCDGSVVADQRGSVRPYGGGCDIGSVERRLELRVDSPLDLVDAAPGDGVCATVSGECTLRAAISESNASGGDALVTIDPEVDPTISIAGRYDNGNLTGDLDITAPITIDGGGATVDGAGLDRVFDLRTGSMAARNLTITGGAGMTNLSMVDLGGGGILAKGDVVLESVSLEGNASVDFPNPFIPLIGPGSAVNVVGDLQLRDSSVVGNVGSAAVFQQGGDLLVERSLFDSNAGGLIAGGPTGGIANSTFIASTVELYPSFPATIRSSTFFATGNAIDAPSATIGGSILSSYSSPCRAPSSPASVGFNVVSVESCGFDDPTDRVGVDPMLGPLADNGGPTRTRLPTADSPAVDRIPAGTSGLCDAGALDQRGFGRPVGGGCDSGAVEGGGRPSGGPLDLVVDTAADELDAAPGDGRCATAAGACSLRAAVVETTLRPTDDRITLTTSVVLDRAGNDENEGLTGDLDVVGALRVEGGGYEIVATTDDRVFDARVGPLTLVDVAVSGGNAITAAAGVDLPALPASIRGGGVHASGGLVLERAEIRGNHALGPGGGVWATSVTMIDSTIADNDAGGQGGGLYAGGASILRSTISGNVANLQGGGAHVVGPTTIAESTIDTNSAGTIGPVSIGGGLNLQLGPATLTNVTISDNDNGGLATNSAPTTIRASTVAGNTAAGIGVGYASVSIGASIVDGPGPACLLSSGPPTSAGGNVIVDTSCGLAGAGDQQATDPLLGLLADHGGPTATRIPAASSPAVDAIAVGTTGLCDGTIATDQRGVVRPSGAGCDAGAVEALVTAVDPSARTDSTAPPGTAPAPSHAIQAERSAAEPAPRRPNGRQPVGQ